MRFLFLALDVDLDRQAGDAIHVRELVRNLAALGHVADVLAESGGKDIETSDRIRVWRTGAEGTRRQVIRALRIAQNVQPDAVYERRLTPKIGLAVSRLSSIPLFVEVNGLPDEERAIREGRTGGPSRLRRWARHQILQKAHSIVTVSEGIRRTLRDVYHISDSKLHVVPNGVDLERFRPMDQSAARNQLGMPARVRILGFTGLLTPWQGVDVLLRALPLVRRKHEAIALVVGDGPDRRRLEALAAFLGIQDHVRFVGEVPYSSVSTYIGAFDVAFCVKPPLLPGSPLKVREYMACGRPVVASAGTEYDFHIVEEAGAGVLADPRIIEDVAAATTSLLANDELRRDMGRRGRLYAEQHCSWAVTARQVAEICAG